MTLVFRFEGICVAYDLMKEVSTILMSSSAIPTGP
jgi:hypothetical protein